MPSVSSVNSLYRFRSGLFLLLLSLAGCSQLPSSTQSSTSTEPELVAAKENADTSDTSRSPETIDSEKPPLIAKELSLLEQAISGFSWGDYSDKEQVIYWRDRYSNNIDQFNAVLERSEPYLFYILQQLEANNLPSELAFLPFVESGYRPDVSSFIGAAGLWQFMPATGRSLGLEQDWWTDERRSVDQSTDAAIEYLKYLYGHFNSDWFMTLAAYNTGEGNLRRAIRNNGGEANFWTLNLNSETASYVPKLLAVVEILSKAQENNLTLPSWPNQPYFEIYEADRQLDIESIADKLNIDTQRLISINAHYPHKITSPNMAARIAIPRGFTTQLDAVIDSLPEVSGLSWLRYQVRSGDNLSVIADRMGVRVRDIVEANQLTSNLIHPGDDLLIPNPDLAAPAQPIQSSVATVRNGDSPWLIARRYGVKLEDLLATNNLTSNDYIHPGQVLNLPSNGGGDSQLTHEVQLGDSLYDIAVFYGVALNDLRAWNALNNSNLIYPGDRLTIWLKSDS